jgi:hypothetical protein
MQDVESFSLETLSLNGHDVQLISGSIHLRTDLITTGSLGSAQVEATTKDGRTLSGEAWVDATENQFSLRGNGDLFVT